MSRYCDVQTEFTDLNALLAALAELGFTEDQVEVHEAAEHLVGYQGDTRKEMAHVIIRRRHIGRASNDVGFFRKDDGTYAAIISDYDRGRFSERWVGQLKGEYAYHSVRQQMTRRGKTVTRTRLANGRQRIQIEGYR